MFVYHSVFLTLLCVISRIVAHAHDCITPNSTAGVCVKISECPKLESLYDHVTTDNYVYLRRLQCGYSGDEQEVCCPTTGTRKTFKINVKPPVRKPFVQIGDRFGPSKTGLPEAGVCGVQSFDNRIFGGEITGIDEFPWMALLEYNKKNANGNGFACGGALIHSRYVLTAAHCASGPTEKGLGGLVSVRLGEYNTETEKDCDPVVTEDCAPAVRDIKIEKKIVHPDYNPDLPHQYHDIALLQLAEAVEFSDFISPICLAKNVENVFSSGNTQFVSGWGITEKAKNSPIKLKLKIPVVTFNSCMQTYSNRFKINLRSTQVCAGGDGKHDSCRGDSGGPLMVPAKVPDVGPTWFMTGVVSIGPTPCATKNVPGVYTKLADYYEWIVENVQ